MDRGNLPSILSAIDLSFPLIQDLRLLKDYVDSIDKIIASLSAHYQEKELSQYGEYDDPGEISYIYQIGEHYLPNAVKMPLVVSIYTSIESNIEQLLEYSRNREGKTLKLKDIKASSNASQYQKYITHVLELDFKLNTSNIADINKIRNCIAHANGNLQHWPESKVEELKKVAERLNKQHNTNIEVGYDLRISTEFLIWCLNVAEGAINPLSEYLRKRYKLYPYHE